MRHIHEKLYTVWFDLYAEMTPEYYENFCKKMKEPEFADAYLMVIYHISYQYDHSVLSKSHYKLDDYYQYIKNDADSPQLSTLWAHNRTHFSVTEFDDQSYVVFDWAGTFIGHYDNPDDFKTHILAEILKDLNK